MRLRWVNTRGSLKHNHSVAPGGTAFVPAPWCVMQRSGSTWSCPRASPGRTGANFFTKDQVMQHSFKCLLISLLPLSQVGCTPSNHDAPTSAPSDSGRFWMTDHEVGAEHLYGAVT